MINEYVICFIDDRPKLEVVAASVELVAGALVFRDEDGNAMQVVAAGTWLRLRCQASAENMEEMVRLQGIRRDQYQATWTQPPAPGEWRYVR